MTVGSFDGWLYDVFMAPAERLGLASRRRDLLHGLRGLVLEIGAGTGLNLPHYGPGPTVIAVDPKMSHIRYARRRQRRGQYLVCARAEALPFRDATFQAAAGTLVFCTVGDPGKGLAELRRVLEPEAELRLIEHVRWERRPTMARLQDWLTPAWKTISDGCHLNRATEKLIEQAGFEIKRRREDFGGVFVELHARLD
ncbi:MAG: class I SAM-dependent methyltransferase [Gemmatimonadota bacterium]|nr:MAG: class I SAM-dependent methyltransferase [Gemmatimonadota bacterium]